MGTVCAPVRKKGNTEHKVIIIRVAVQQPSSFTEEYVRLQLSHMLKEKALDFSQRSRLIPKQLTLTSVSTPPPLSSTSAAATYNKQHRHHPTSTGTTSFSVGRNSGCLVSKQGGVARLPHFLSRELGIRSLRSCLA